MREIEDLFWRIGILASYDGYCLLKFAIYFVWSGQCDMHHVTKGLYPMVARQCNVKNANVERNMRTAIDAFWERGNREYLREISHLPITHRPTATEFIGIAVGYLKHCEQHV